MGTDGRVDGRLSFVANKFTTNTAAIFRQQQFFVFFITRPRRRPQNTKHRRSNLTRNTNDQGLKKKKTEQKLKKNLRHRCLNKRSSLLRGSRQKKSLVKDKRLQMACRRGYTPCCTPSILVEEGTPPIALLRYL